MKSFAFVVLIAVAATPLFAQTHSDRNLRRTRSTVSTASPPPATGAKESNVQLDRLEQQTARLMAQPAGKPKVATVPKHPATSDRPSTGFQQTLPVHAQSGGPKSGMGTSGHSNRGGRYGR